MLSDDTSINKACSLLDSFIILVVIICCYRVVQAVVEESTAVKHCDRKYVHFRTSRLTAKHRPQYSALSTLKQRIHTRH